LRLSEEELWRTQTSKARPPTSTPVWGEDDLWRMKADPYGFRSELRPNTASPLCDLSVTQGRRE
jgi:1,4-alpha-glucan branching enzyme